MTRFDSRSLPSVATRACQFRLRTCAAAALLAAASAVSWAKDAPAPVPVDAGFKPVQQAGPLLTVAEGKALKGISKAAVPLFSVEFVTADSARAETSGFAAAGRASAAVYYKLIGVAEPEFQALTDGLYADFVRDLKAAGVEVVPQEQLAASALYKKMAANGSPSPIKADGSLTLAPSGMAIYGMNKAASGTGGGQSMFSALSSIGSSMSAISAVMDTVALQKELSAAILEVQVKVHFVQLTNNNRGFLGRLSSTASVDSKVFPHISSAMMSVQSAVTRAAVTLNTPLALDAAAFAEVRKAPTTAGDVAAGVAVALIRLASNSSDSSSSDEMQAVADPARYRDVVGGGLGAVREMFVARVKAGE